MERGTVASASLDFIEFQVFPSQNRYEAYVYLGSKKEPVTSGPLTQLLRHSDKVKGLHSNGSVANIKLERPGNLGISKWFSKSSLQRFLHFIASSNGLNSTNDILNEISQLEEARRFHISLYAKGFNPDSRTEEKDGSYLNGSTPEAETDSISSDASKNELVRAMDLRLAALRGELANAVDKASGGPCPSEDIIDLMKLSNYLGSSELGKALRKFVEMFHREQIVDLPNEEHSPSANDSGDHGRGSLKEDCQIAKPPQSDTPVMYGVSPAKAAQAERLSSSESEESSYSSEEDLPIAERSRTPIRSASPMRRVQIGRTGSRRSTPLTIKSLPYIPARERVVSHKETASNSSDEEQSRKPEKNITRLSVQDAVKLFENKQKEQNVDGQKDRSLSNAVIGANKSVLRRWSSGTGESFKYPSDVASESVPTGSSALEGEEGEANSSEAKPESESASNGHTDEPSKVNVEINPPGCTILGTEDMQEISQPIAPAGISERLTSSAEWSRQKEAELNQLLVKMMETRPTKYQSIPVSGKTEKNPSDASKEKRNLKLRGAGKRAEKEKQSRGMQQTLEERRSAVASKISSGTGGHENAKKPQKALKSVSQSAKPKADPPKPTVIKRSTQKSSPLPATRKSWPSTLPPRGTATNSASTTSSGLLAGGTIARRKSQPTQLTPLPNPKVEGSQLRQNPVKRSQSDLKKNTKALSEKNLQPKVKSGKTAKPIKSQSAAADPPPSAKPSLYSKVTRKSSVVPLESKPFLKKGTGIGSGVSTTGKTKSSPQQEIPVINSADLIHAKENDFVPESPSIAIEQPESDVEGMKVHVDADLEIVTGRLQVHEEQKIPDKITPKDDDTSERIMESPLMSEAEEETIISPAAWVEIEEQEDQPNRCIGGNISHIESACNSVQVKMPSPRVRHSLSQMLLEEINEPHVTEWGNAENPPSMIYQKDAPKGLKRLLKFARKSKTDASSSGWSSPSVFSEGEDDIEDSKAINKKNAGYLLKKATLRSLESYEDNPASRELSAQANTSKSSLQTLSQKLREGHASAPVTNSKASRSFFSLSAFKGGN